MLSREKGKINTAVAQFSKLTNINYYVWKFNIELLLLERELWNDAKRLAQDIKARAATGLAVEESQKILIKYLKTAVFFKETS